MTLPSPAQHPDWKLVWFANELHGIVSDIGVKSDPSRALLRCAGRLWPDRHPFDWRVLLAFCPCECGRISMFVLMQKATGIAGMQEEVRRVGAADTFLRAGCASEGAVGSGDQLGMFA